MSVIYRQWERAQRERAAPAALVAHPPPAPEAERQPRALASASRGLSGEGCTFQSCPSRADIEYGSGGERAVR